MNSPLTLPCYSLRTTLCLQFCSHDIARAAVNLCATIVFLTSLSSRHVAITWQLCCYICPSFEPSTYYKQRSATRENCWTNEHQRMLYARKYAIKLWTFTMRRMYLYRMKYSGTSPRLVCDLVACDAFDFELLVRWKVPLIQSFKLCLEPSCAERGITCRVMVHEYIKSCHRLFLVRDCD